MFIVGSPRSGTTLLGEILDLHPDIAQWYEPYFVWRKFFRDAVHDERSASEATPGIKQYIHKSFVEYRRKIKHAIVVDKSPGNSLTIPFILEIFPNAHFIHILRDGRDVSMMEGIHPYREFRPDTTTPPPGMHDSAFYRQHVSFDAANYKFAPAISDAVAMPRLRVISPLIGDLLTYLTACEPTEPAISDDLLKRKASSSGLSVVWVYVGLSDGTLLNYPGNGMLKDEYDPRLRPWYTEAEKRTGTVWSSPYVDAFGLGMVISASKAIRDKQGRLLGVVSMDMTFDRITKMMQHGDQTDAVINRYLIDEDGDVVLHGTPGRDDVKEAAKTFTEVAFDTFPYPEIKGQIKRRAAGQFSVERDGQTRLISYAPVRTLSWYYVEEIDKDAALKRY